MVIAFDLDGTLIDSARDLANAASELVQSYGGAPLAIEDVVQMVGDGAAVLVRRALEKAGVDARPREALDRYLEIYDRRMLDHTLAYPGIAESLALAVARGPLAVLTNKPLAPSLRLLDALNLSGFFSDVIGGDSRHGRKPAPEGMRALMALEPGAPAILIGDSPADANTAAAAGCAFAFARYGFGAGKFGEGGAPNTPYILDHARELSRVLDRFSDG